MSGNASKEASLQAALDKMQADWASMAFRLIEYKDTGTYITGGTDEIQARRLFPSRLRCAEGPLTLADPPSRAAEYPRDVHSVNTSTKTLALTSLEALMGSRHELAPWWVPVCKRLPERCGSGWPGMHLEKLACNCCRPTTRVLKPNFINDPRERIASPSHFNVSDCAGP